MLVLAYFYGSNGEPLLRKFRTAIQKYGNRVDLLNGQNYSGYSHCDVAITIAWNPAIARIHEDLRSRGKTFLAISDGYVFRRNRDACRYYGISKNGLHAYGEHIDPARIDPFRKELVGLDCKPWRTDGDHIVVAHQHYSHTVDGTDRQNWFGCVLSSIKRLTDRPIVFRGHPRDSGAMAVAERFGLRLSERSTLAEDLEGAWALITFDSNAAVDSVMAGIPAFVGGPTMADPVVNKNIDNLENPAMPDREQWLSWLAYTQWNEKEFAFGFPWGFFVEKFLIYKKPSGNVRRLFWDQSDAEQRALALGAL